MYRDSFLLLTLVYLISVQGSSIFESRAIDIWVQGYLMSTIWAQYMYIHANTESYQCLAWLWCPLMLCSLLITFMYYCVWLWLWVLEEGQRNLPVAFHLLVAPSLQTGCKLLEQYYVASGFKVASTRFPFSVLCHNNNNWRNKEGNRGRVEKK